MDGFGKNIKKVLLAGIGAVAITDRKIQRLTERDGQKG